MRSRIELSNSSRIPIWANFDELFERAFSNPLSLLDETPPLMTEERWLQPQFNIKESDQAYFISLDIPGVSTEDLKIDLADNTLNIYGERKYFKDITDKSTSGFQNFSRKFQRSFRLPDSVDADQIEANLENGVLTIALPKIEVKKPRSIEIQNGRGGFLSRLISSKKKETKAEESTH